MAVVSPSFSPVRNNSGIELIKTAKDFASSENFKLNFMDNWDKTNGKEGGSVEEKTNDLMQAAGSQVSIVISSNGGRGVMGVLNDKLIDTLAKSNKWLSGMSDTAPLLNALTFKKGLVTIYGVDLLWGVGKLLRNEHWVAFKDLISLGKIETLNKYSFIPLTDKSTAEGRIMGGCLTSFFYLLGTKYDPMELCDENFILVLEDIFGSLGDVVDKFYQLTKTPNFLNKCQGVILGNFMSENSDESNKLVQDKAIEIFKQVSIPVFKSENIGHGVENMPLLIGAKVAVDGKKSYWSI